MGLLDYLHLHGCSHCLLPYGEHFRRNRVEDFVERRCLGHLGRSGPLLLHARILDYHWNQPNPYRYIDWSITVPLQMVEFYFILSAVNDKIGSGMFFRLFCGTVMMLAFGYAGESHFLMAWPAFALGMAGWGFILYEVFAGEAGKEAGNASGHVQSSYTIMKFIVSVGWSIYPAGYFFGYLIFNHSDDAALNLIYNLADFVNKIAFCLAIWQCAKADTAMKSK